MGNTMSQATCLYIGSATSVSAPSRSRCGSITAAALVALGTSLSGEVEASQAGLAQIGCVSLPCAHGALEVGTEAETCPDCSITVDTIAVLGAVDDPFSPSFRSSVSSVKGGFIVGPLEGVDAVALYQKGSPPVLIGTPGEGPGEFRGVDEVEVVGGRVHVFSSARETILDEEFNVIEMRRIPAGGILDATVVGETSIVEAFGRTSHGSGLRLLRIGETGDSVLAEKSLREDALNLVGLRTILGPGSGGFWTATANRYEFELLSTTGEILRRLVPSDQWFPEIETDPRAAIDPLREAPPPVVTALREDAAGRLWIASHHPAKEPRPLSGGDDGYGSRAARHPRVIDSIIEILDASTGQSIARKRFEGMVSGFPGDGIVALRDLGPFGVTTIHIVKLEVRRVRS